MKKNKKKLRVLAIALVAVMIMMSANFTVSAAPPGEITEPLPESVISPADNDTAPIEILSQEVVGEDILPITEIVERREENVKHFRLPNGTVEAVSYAKPVHRMGADGVWQDIDNNLRVDNTKAPDVYVTDDPCAIYVRCKRCCFL